MSEQPERVAFKEKVEALRARLDAAEAKLETIEQVRDEAKQVWRQARADLEAQQEAWRAEVAILKAEAEALGEDHKRLPPKPVDVASNYRSRSEDNRRNSV
jgi:hypothetical protein